jgi:methionyl aminopeptidase
MATLGGEAVYIDKDRWTVRVRDGSRSAHFEHTVLITEDSAEILTTL